jgi:Spy/CpxP family protein refolding chaperone
MKTKWILLPIALVLVFAATQLGFSQPNRDFGPGSDFEEGPRFGPGPGPGCGDGPGFGRGHGEGLLERAEELELTPEQVKKIKAMRLDLAKETIELRNQLELKHLEFGELMAADQPDLKRIEAKIDEIAPLRTTLEKKRIENMLAIREVLTPEQRAKLETMRGSGMRHQRGQRTGFHKDREDRNREPERR